MSSGTQAPSSFTRITQHWLRESAKRWAADDLPRRRLRPGRRTSVGLAVRHHVNCLALLSGSLRLRPDRGERPGALERADIETFLNRLAYLGLSGTDQQRRPDQGRPRGACRARRELVPWASLVRARLPPAWVRTSPSTETTSPEEPEPASSRKRLAERGHVPAVRSPWRDLFARNALWHRACHRHRAAPRGEFCDLAFDCWARDDDGLPVLIFDNNKANRLGRRLPIAEATAQLLIAQQQRVRALFPSTPVGELKLLPTDRRNPDGRQLYNGFQLGFPPQGMGRTPPTVAHCRRRRARQAAHCPLRLQA